MGAQKYSASMDEDLLEQAKEAAEAAGVTLSAWLTELARDRVALLGLDRVVTEWENEHGKITDEEIAAVDAKVAAAMAEARARKVPPRAESA